MTSSIVALRFCWQDSAISNEQHNIACTRGATHECCRVKKRHQDFRRAYGRRSARFGRAGRDCLWIHRTERLRQDDHAADDHADFLSRSRHDPCAGPGAWRGGRRPHRISARRARAVQENAGARRAAVLCRAKGRRDCRAAIDQWLARMELSDWADKRSMRCPKACRRRCSSSRRSSPSRNW